MVDAAAGTAFVMNLEGDVDALDLATGSLKWRSLAAAKPLLAAPGHLLALVPPGEQGQMVLAVLGTAAGALQQRLEVAFPPGIRANLADGPAEATEVQAFVAPSADRALDGRAAEAARHARAGGGHRPAIPPPAAGWRVRRR